MAMPGTRAVFPIRSSGRTHFEEARKCLMRVVIDACYRHIGGDPKQVLTQATLPASAVSDKLARSAPTPCPSALPPS